MNKFNWISIDNIVINRCILLMSSYNESQLIFCATFFPIKMPVKLTCECKFETNLSAYFDSSLNASEPIELLNKLIARMSHKSRILHYVNWEEYVCIQSIWQLIRMLIWSLTTSSIILKSLTLSMSDRLTWGSKKRGCFLFFSSDIRRLLSSYFWTCSCKVPSFTFWSIFFSSSINFSL